MFSVVQSACLFFGGTFDPAYILTITAIPTQLQPVTNKRNAYLLEKVIEDELGITPSRGVIRFMPLPAENLALGGRTWEVDTAELEAGRPRTSRLQSLGYEKRKQSLGPLRGVKSRGQVSAGGKYGPTPPNEPSSPPPVPEHPMTLAPGDIDAINAQRLQTLGRRKKSFAEYLGLRQYWVAPYWTPPLLDYRSKIKTFLCKVEFVRVKAMEKSVELNFKVDFQCRLSY
jgi:hypothetical protein